MTTRFFWYFKCKNKPNQGTRGHLYNHQWMKTRLLRTDKVGHQLIRNVGPVSQILGLHPQAKSLSLSLSNWWPSFKLARAAHTNFSEQTTALITVAECFYIMHRSIRCTNLPTCTSHNKYPLTVTPCISILYLKAYIYMKKIQHALCRQDCFYTRSLTVPSAHTPKKLTSI